MIIWVIRNDIILPSIPTMDNTPCVELLHGASLDEHVSHKPGGLLSVMTKAYSSYKSSKAGDKKSEYMLQEIVFKFDVHLFFIASHSLAGESKHCELVWHQPLCRELLI